MPPSSRVTSEYRMRPSGRSITRRVSRPSRKVPASRPFEAQSTHVRDVKQSCCASRRLMLLGDRRVLHRHRPAGEVDHPAAVSTMPGVQGSLGQSSGHANSLCPSADMSETVKLVRIVANLCGVARGERCRDGIPQWRCRLRLSHAVGGATWPSVGPWPASSWRRQGDVFSAAMATVSCRHAGSTCAASGA